MFLTTFKCHFKKSELGMSMQPVGVCTYVGGCACRRACMHTFVSSQMLVDDSCWLMRLWPCPLSVDAVLWGLRQLVILLASHQSTQLL